MTKDIFLGILLLALIVVGIVFYIRGIIKCPTCGCMKRLESPGSRETTEDGYVHIKRIFCPLCTHVFRVITRRY